MKISTSELKFSIELSKDELSALWLLLDEEAGASWENHEHLKGATETLKAILEGIEDWKEFFSLDLDKEKRKLLLEKIPF